ncbi:hypothetical protein [Streptomyces sp. NPDC091046]|uniref:hypothetical protein n=1 Tax=Streptomyces sp. NPDC091046 TaxID=3365973 RepID=UPI003820B429
MRSAWLLPGGPSEPGQTREDTRLSPLGTYTPESELRTRSGVLAGGNPFAATGAGPMLLQIGAGRGLVQGTDAQGAYPVCLDAPVTVTFEDGAAQFTRIDSVVARVYDGLYDTEGQTLATVERITGDAAAEPSPPPLPAGCLRLWDVAVPAGTSAGVGGIDWGVALTDRRRYTSAHGGIVPRGVASDVGAYDGQYADFDGTLYRWSAADAQWELYRPPAAATEVITSGVTMKSGWALLLFQARRRDGVCTITVEARRTGSTIVPTSSGNITDLPVCTLPAGWRPPIHYEGNVSDGYGAGECTFNPDGDALIRTWSTGGQISNDPQNTYRLSATFVQ